MVTEPLRPTSPVCFSVASGPAGVNGFMRRSGSRATGPGVPATHGRSRAWSYERGRRATSREACDVAGTGGRDETGVPPVGLEPTTCGLKVRSSTD